MDNSVVKYPDALPSATELRRNIELKARCGDLDRALSASISLGAKDTGMQQQVDTYFRVSNGRLKLREISTTTGTRAELIWYERSDAAESRRSDYRLVPTEHPAELKAALTAANEMRGEVRKNRHVLLWHNVRIHLDAVADLGTFVEFEAVMGEHDDEATGHQRLQILCDALSIPPGDYERTSYAELKGL